MTPAEQLAAATEKVLALAAAAAPGPWHVHLPNGYPQAIYSEGSDNEIFAEVLDDIDQPKPNAPYIAAMHPGVGAALAGLLTAATRLATAYPEMVADHDRPACDDYTCDVMGAALAVAREILGQPDRNQT